jgi:signal transduction histidine kinase
MGTSASSSPPSPNPSSRRAGPPPLPGALGLVQAALQEVLHRHAAERRIREQNQFISMLAHDLRTPLTVIKNTAGIIRRHAPPSAVPMEPAAATIIRMVDRTDGMIRNLLDCEKATAGEAMRLERQPMELVSAVGSVLADLALVHGERFRLVSRGPVEGRWDPGGVRRVVENLLTNAAKYGDPQAEITVEIRDDADLPRLSVHNHGKPIDRRARAAIFKPFHRGRSASRQIEGWGLGLALVRGISRAHGGTVAVRSSRRHGTTFTVTLPRG